MLLLDDINRIANEAGLSSSDLRIKQLVKDAYDLGMQHERKACAGLCETSLGPTATDFYGKVYAKAIRERGKP
jgi:hypothetical protein